MPAARADGGSWFRLARNVLRRCPRRARLPPLQSLSNRPTESIEGILSEQECWKEWIGYSAWGSTALIDHRKLRKDGCTRLAERNSGKKAEKSTIKVIVSCCAGARHLEDGSRLSSGSGDTRTASNRPASTSRTAVLGSCYQRTWRRRLANSSLKRCTPADEGTKHRNRHH